MLLKRNDFVEFCHVFPALHRTDPPPRGSQDMSDKPKRKFWQMGLGSMIALTTCAGALLGLNITDRSNSDSHVFNVEESEFHGPGHNTVRGWPLSIT